MSKKEYLLSSKQMAEFVGQGFLKFDELVPRSLCDEFLTDIESLNGYLEVGKPFKNIWKDQLIGEIFRLPQLDGIIESLVGPSPLYDHHAIHKLSKNTQIEPNVHQDSVTDLRDDYFDIQISFFPQHTPREAGGTFFIPGTHFRNIRTGESKYYHHILGEKHVACKGGTIVVWNARLWHGARSNFTNKPRYMFKLRLNPTIKQICLFDISDLQSPKIPNLLRVVPAFSGHDARYEIMKRVQQWRFISNQPNFEIGEQFLRRIEYIV